MACVLTDGLGVAARATPWPPRALVVPLAPLSCSIDAFAKEEWQLKQMGEWMCKRA